MKKKILLLSVISMFAIAGCGNTAEEPKEEEKKPDYTALFNLVSPEDTCMVNPKVKEYTDKMYAQREAGGMNGEVEDKIVNPLYAETTKVKDYKGDYDENVPLELSFTVDDSIKEESFKVRYWVDGDEKNYKEVEPTDGKVSLANLFRSTDYKWKVVSSEGKESKVESFTTGDYIRFLTCGKLFNVRDNGGWTTLEGRKIKQGLVYRGGEINEHTFSNHSQNVFGDDDPAKKIFVDDFGIRVEIDLRAESEADGQNSCYMNVEGQDASDPRFVEFTRLNIGSYHSAVNSTSDQAKIKTIFEDYLAHADEKPVYYHCYGGADRTGTIGFLLGALLGMSYTDLIIDYEATTFSNNLKEHDRDSDQYTHFPELISAIKAWPFYDESKSLSEIIEIFLVSTCKVSQDAIDTIRDIMLED